jgi:hypothetical protein
MALLLKATERHGNVAIGSALCDRTSAAVMIGPSTVRRNGWVVLSKAGQPAAAGFSFLVVVRASPSRVI